ncbi:hypothetical protein N7526_008743 [Penicillium atrosanguineum]|nr:hypothetical protein N7526_008743 [Penicillium atrosanguineum]
MRWPPWSSESSDDQKKQSESSLGSWSSHATSTNNSSPLDWTAFTEARTILPTLLLTSGILFAVRVHRSYLRRFPDAASISPSFLRRRTVFGQVTSVGDGDNFRIYHTPGGRLAGWGWLPWKKVPSTKKELKDKTIHIRLAGVDAPELAHFGRPEQPFARDAHPPSGDKTNTNASSEAYTSDAHSTSPPFRKRDVSYEMLKRGLATVYEAKVGAEFGGEAMEQKYRRAEWWAKKRAKGLWKDYRRVGSDWESPRE